MENYDHASNFKSYNSSMHEKLRFPFNGSESIEKIYSQSYQDLFVLSVLDGKRNGRFLEIGGYLPFFGNNTALLEEKFGWSGISVEIMPEAAEQYRISRPSTHVICADATTLNYTPILQNLAMNGIVDYLQLDCDPPQITYQVLEKIPLNKYKFGVITYEHDAYYDPNQTYRTKSRELFKSYGYELILGNVAINELVVYEDWWVHPDVINVDILHKMQWQDSEINIIDNYIFL